jgi:hypothetical protein
MPSIAEQLRALAASIESQEQASDLAPWSFPHPESERLFETRNIKREQLSYTSPEALQIRERVRAYNADHGNPGSGNVVAGILDAALRAHGYPPVPE